MEMSFEEIGTLMGWLGMSSDGVAFRGADRFMESPDDIVDSAGARRIIEAAMADDDRLLHVVAIGAVTNIAAALLMEPEIITRMVVSWTSGYPTFVRFSNSPSMNLVQDQHASRLLFDSGVPLLYLPGYYIGEQLVMSLPESERWVNRRGRSATTSTTSIATIAYGLSDSSSPSRASPGCAGTSSTSHG